MAITYGIKIHFGTGYSTPLPEGWKLVESKEEFALAVTPDGKEYFLGPDKAFPRRKWGTDGIPAGSKPGEYYIDTENGIIDLQNKGIGK